MAAEFSRPVFPRLMRPFHHVLFALPHPHLKFNAHEMSPLPRSSLLSFLIALGIHLDLEMSGKDGGVRAWLHRATVGCVSAKAIGAGGVIDSSARWDVLRNITGVGKNEPVKRTET